MAALSSIQGVNLGTVCDTVNAHVVAKMTGFVHFVAVIHVVSK